MAATLPKWLTRNRNGVFKIDPDIAYQIVLDTLGAKEPDQHSIEVAYQCSKLAAQEVAARDGVDPTKTALLININADGGRKNRWALAKFAPGRGVAAATKGGEAKAHYERIRSDLLG